MRLDVPVNPCYNSHALVSKQKMESYYLSKKIAPNLSGSCSHLRYYIFVAALLLYSLFGLLLYSLFGLLLYSLFGLLLYSLFGLLLYSLFGLLLYSLFGLLLYSLFGLVVLVCVCHRNSYSHKELETFLLSLLDI